MGVLVDNLKASVIVFCKVDDDYGVDWDGPHAVEDADSISIPDVELPRDLTAEELAGLPNREMTLNEAIDAYMSTVAQLTEIFRH